MPGGAAEHGAILVVDDLHTPIDGVFGRNASHLQEVLKRAIVSGQLQCISIATSSGYAKSIVDHGRLEASFQPVAFGPPVTATRLRSCAESKISMRNSTV